MTAVLPETTDELLLICNRISEACISEKIPSNWLLDLRKMQLTERVVPADIANITEVLGDD